MRVTAAVAALAAVLALTAVAGPPPTRRGDQVDDYHGERIADPYRWLEDVTSTETQVWIAAQDAYARSVLDALPGRAGFRARLRALIDYERFGVPQLRAGRYAYTWNRGSDDQDSLWISDDPAARGRLVVDPLARRADGTVSLAGFELAPDGRHLAYALADGGSDWTHWQVHDVAAGRDLPEVLEGTKFTDIAWARDGRSFWYSRYPARAGGGWDDGRQVAIWQHVPGTPQSADRQVYAIDDHPTRNPYPLATEDGRYLVIRVEDGYQTSGLYVLDLAAPQAAALRLFDRWDARYEFLGNDGPVFYVHTTQGAPTGRVVAVDLRKPAPEHWRELVPAAANAITAASLTGGRLLVQYVADLRSLVRVFGSDGRAQGEVVLPGAGTVAGFTGERHATETFFSYTDYTTPRGVYRYEPASGRVTPWRVPAGVIDPGAYVARQFRYRSRDGTEVPLTLVHRRDLPVGTRPLPAVLYGYGGFNVTLLPVYSAARAAWLEAGGLLAVANLRGGGEFGEAWHEAGTRLVKQNVFDDFIAAAEWLLAGGYSSPTQLAIWGASNGGLLVGAVLNQRPELFAAAVPAVGVMDMLRYQLTSANARQWSSDYGLSEVPAEFRALRRYSPLHNTVVGTCYPPTLVMADANDDRVAPWHSYKYAAALQHAQGCANPVPIRIERRAGHGAGAALGKLVEEYADQWAFVAQATGLAPPPLP